MNILVTSIGSFSGNVVLKKLRYFKCKLVGTSIYPASWSYVSKFTDVFYQIAHSSNKNDYINNIIDICKKEDISHIVPLTDPEVDILSGIVSDLDSLKIKLCLSDAESIKLCRNKYNVYLFLKKIGLDCTVPTYLLNDINEKNIQLPMIAKPVYGKSSEGLFKITNRKDYLYVKGISKNVEMVVQPIIVGDLITADIIRDPLNEIIITISRIEHIRTKKGAGLTVTIINDAKIKYIAEKIVSLLNIKGCINIEFVRENNRYYLLDINPRFSAGVAFTCLSGYDMVSNHIKCFIGEKIDGITSIKTCTMEKVYEERIIYKIEDTN